MATVTVTVPASGAGASVSIAAFPHIKTALCAGSWSGNVILEISDDNINFEEVCLFIAPGYQVIRADALWIRARVSSNYTGGAVCSVVAEDATVTVAFATPQEVIFPSPQEVEFATPQEVEFATPQEVIFPSATPQEITIGDTAARDAFYRLRTSDSESLFDYAPIFSLHNGLLWSQSTSGGGSVTHLTASSQVRLRVGTASGDSAIRQTKQYHAYQPGKSHQITMTGIIGAAKANVRQRIGLFDANNGVFFQQNNGLGVVLRTATSGAPVDQVVLQAAWNLDALNGLGPSGVTIDPSKNQLFVMDLQWLGSGRVRIGIVNDDLVIYCHEFLNTNRLEVPYMATATLPVRYEITNTGTSASQTDLIQVCSSVASEGGHEPIGIPRCAHRGTTIIAAGADTIVPVVSIRLASAFARALLVPTEASLQASIDQDTLVLLILNPTLTGASFNAVASGSFSEFDIAATALTGGTQLVCQYTGQKGAISLNFLNINVPIAADIAGVSDILTLAVMPTANANAVGGINFIEIG